MTPVSAHFSFEFSIKLPPIEFSCFKLWFRENFRSRKAQKVKGGKVTRKIKIFHKKTQTVTIFAMYFVQKQLNLEPVSDETWYKQTKKDKNDEV